MLLNNAGDLSSMCKWILLYWNGYGKWEKNEQNWRVQCVY